MPYGIPKTDAERVETHESLYGTSDLPPRGTGLKGIGLQGGWFTEKLGPLALYQWGLIALGAWILLAKPGMKTSRQRRRLIQGNPKGNPVSSAKLPGGRKVNVATTDLATARVYATKEFSKSGKTLSEELPNFDKNYLRLRDQCSFALDIPRRRMPVIEPVDMVKFQRKIKAGHIDLFRPYASTNLFPEKLTDKQGSKWLTLGLKDGKIEDDTLRARLRKIPAKDLKPLQSQIWLDLVVKYMLSHGLPTRASSVVNTTIIVSEENYILDGHHRYGQVMLADPNLKMSCLHVPLNIGILLKMGRTYGKAIGHEPNV